MVTGVKKAVGDFKRFNRGGDYSPEYGFLMLDRETGEVWTDYFYNLGHNNWKEYEKSSIINLGAMMQEQKIEINMKNVKDFAKGLLTNTF